MSPPPAPPQLLERGPVQIELSHRLHEAGEARGRLLFLAGEAGIGKTSLLARFAELVAGRARVLVGACDPLSTPRPLAPLVDVRAQLGARSADRLRQEAEGDSLFRAFLAELSREGPPTLCVFEDVHWADEATLDLLRFLGRRLGSAPALLVATYRSDEVGERHPLRVVLGDLATAPAVERMSLAPLSLAAVRTLAQGSGLDAERLHAKTGGNPFFVREVVAARGLAIPDTVRDAVLARAARLPEDARQVLDAAAVLGLRFEPWLLEALAGAAAPAIDACLAAGLLRAEGERLVFHHELARDALLQALPPHRRQALHRAALDVLGARGEGIDPGRLAHHAEGAGDAEAVLLHAPAAARAAVRVSAHREAAAQFARALRFADRLPLPEQAQLWTEYSWCHAAIDQWDEAVRADYRIIGCWQQAGDRVKEGWAMGFLVGCLVSSGRFAEAREAAQKGVEILEALPPTPELARAYLVQSYVSLMQREPAEAEAWAERARALAEAHAFGSVRADVWVRLGSAKLAGGDPEGERLLLRALEEPPDDSLHWRIAGVNGNLGALLSEQWSLAAAERYLVQGVTHARAHELEGSRMVMQATLAAVQLQQGRWAEAEASAELVRERPSSNAISHMVAEHALGWLLSRRGDPEASEVLDRALALALPTGALHRVARVRATRAEAAWMAGDLARAREEVHAALPLALGKRHAWFAGELLAWLSRAGEPVEAPDWIARPFRLQIEGEWREAALEWERLGCPWEAALARAETGEAEAVRSAVGTLEALGARPALALVTRRLRERGARGIPRGPRPSTRANPGQLTRREVEVVQLLAEGLRNAEIARRLFLSPKTVGHHVSAVLEKLGVRSRGEAAHAAARLGILQDGEGGAPR